MPKKVFGSFFTNMVRDIKNNYQSGDKFLSIRNISQKYKVSIQTAQRGVKQLEEYGYISVKRKAGITIESLRPQKKLEGYKIVVVSATADSRFNNSFYKGICEVADNKGLSADFIQIKDMDTNTLQFGNYLLSLNADGIIALAFYNSALPFYHVIREGVDIVADIILDELPILPAVQTDNFRHARTAGHIFLEKGYRRFLVVGYNPVKRNRRYEGIYDIVKDHCDNIQYVCLRDLNCMNKIDAFFNTFNKHSAVFAVDYSTNYIIGNKFVQHAIEVENDNFLVYDCEEDFFINSRLKPVQQVAPSMKTIGCELCKTLIAKRETGAYPLPLQRKI